MAQCIGCGGELHPSLTEPYHPSCMLRDNELSAPYQLLATELKTAVTEIIRWADSASDRSLQLAPGPSELGDACDRRLAYRLAQIPELGSRADPWAAIVGTAVHNWLEKAIQKWMIAANAPDEWITERAVNVDDFVVGHVDAYWRPYQVVVDWKTMSNDRMNEVRDGGAAAVPGYIVQAHLYGLAYQRLGLEVKSVALLCLPRAGRLRDAHPIVEPFDPRIAQYALDRMYGIAGRLVELDVYSNPVAWQQIEAKPSNSCGLCPWYDSNRLIEADATGCPGR